MRCCFICVARVKKYICVYRSVHGSGEYCFVSSQPRMSLGCTIYLTEGEPMCLNAAEDP